MNKRNARSGTAARVTCAAAGLVAVLLACAVHAAGTYDIELVVFERVTPDRSGEQFSSEPGFPPNSGAGSYPAAQRALGGTVAQLRQSSQYRVLVHRAWRQPGVSRNNSRATPVQSEDGYKLTGSVTVWRQRFLHTKVDLLLRPSDGSQAVRMQESRRMRSKEIHYLDHPKIGVLLYARPAG